MHFISHRGNTFGPEPDNENNPKYIMDTLARGYECEIDVWYIDNSFWLGHDQPEYQISDQFLRYENKRMWCHAKNLDALRIMLNLGVHCFWHQEDDYTVTSKGWIWAYPNKPGNQRTIAVMPELHNTDVAEFAGICSDFIEKYHVEE